MKATRKLIPAIALLLVSAVLLSTASYAWFTTNKVVNTDMSVSVTAPQNLQISVDNGATYKANHDFRGTPATYTKLTPVSSKDGKNFVLVKGLTLEQDGVLTQEQVTALAADATHKNGEISKVTSSTNAGETYYLQYDFKLKATQAIASEDFLIAVKLNAKGANALTDEAYKNAIRVFIFQNNVLVNTVGGTGAKPIVATTTGEGEGATTTYTVEAAIDSAQSVAAFESNVPQNWSVVIWIEGNDPACISANIDADPDIDVDITFSIDET